MLPTDLGVASRGLNCRGALFGHVPQVVSHLLNSPSSGAGPVRKVVPEIVEGNIVNQSPFFFVGLRFKRSETSDECQPR